MSSKPTLPPSPPSPDLNDAIISEIEKTFAVSFKSKASPLLGELLDYLIVTRQALAHREAALSRIHQTLTAARSLPDNDLTTA
jgi:hypothetical protein